MSISSTPPVSTTTGKTNVTRPARVTVKSKKIIPPTSADTGTSIPKREPSYTDSLESSRSVESGGECEGDSTQAHQTAAASAPPTPPVEYHDDGDQVEEEEHSDSYYVRRQRPSLTVAERVERLKAAQADALQARAVQQLPSQGIARRPAVLVRTRHGTVKSHRIADQPARNASSDGPLAIADRCTSEESHSEGEDDPHAESEGCNASPDEQQVDPHSEVTLPFAAFVKQGAELIEPDTTVSTAAHVLHTPPLEIELDDDDDNDDADSTTDDDGVSGML